jgi:hypothetical protein
MDDREIRLRILEAVMPQATRVGLSDPPMMIKTCTMFEQYVLDFKEGEKLSDSPPKRKTGRPAKGTENDLPSFLDPTHGG